MAAIKQRAEFSGLWVFQDRNDNRELWFHIFGADKGAGCWVFVHEVNPDGTPIQKRGGLFFSSLKKNYFTKPEYGQWKVWCLATKQLVDLRDKSLFPTTQPGSPDNEDALAIERENARRQEEEAAAARRPALTRATIWEMGAERGNEYGQVLGNPSQFGVTMTGYNGGQAYISDQGKFDAMRRKFPNAVFGGELRHESFWGNTYPDYLIDYSRGQDAGPGWSGGKFLKDHPDLVGINGNIGRDLIRLGMKVLYMDWSFEDRGHVDQIRRLREVADAEGGKVSLNVNFDEPYFQDLADIRDREVPHEWFASGATNRMEGWIFDAIDRLLDGDAEDGVETILRYPTDYFDVAQAVYDRYAQREGVTLKLNDYCATHGTCEPERLWEPS